jgi:6-phosphogluconolactonase (cycloisomerase 2 family)
MSLRPRLAALATIAGLAIGSSGLFAGSAVASGDSAGVVFVQTDGVDGNAIVAYDRRPDGSLRQAGTYSTGGKGGILGGSVVDHLASQGSLAYDSASQLLYAVNAGSDTITVFSVSRDRLTQRQVVASRGSFPVSVAVHGSLVYVLNARDGGSIQGYVRVGASLLPIPSWHRSLALDPNATPEFTHSPGQIAFTPDGQKLIVTTKANTDSVDVFDLDAFGSPSAQPVVTSLPGKVPFAVTFDSRGRLLVAEAGPNAVESFTISDDGHLASLAQVATGQAATCWIVGAGDVFYVSNAASASVTAVRADDTLSLLGKTSTGAGTVDAAITPDGSLLYVQTGAAGNVDAFRINTDGSLTAIGSVTVPGAVGGEGIVAL